MENNKGKELKRKDLFSILITVMCCMFLGCFLYIMATLPRNSGKNENNEMIDKKSFQERLNIFKGIEIMPNVFDDQQSTVYIGIDHKKIFQKKQSFSEENRFTVQTNLSIAEIIAKKRSWEIQFPDKKIVAMSVVTGIGFNDNLSIPVGLLIHYESR